MSDDPKPIPPPGFVAKLPPVGTVFTDQASAPGPGWRWSDEAAPPRWLPPDASSPHFAQAITDAWNKAHEPLLSPLPQMVNAPDPTGQDRGQGEGNRCPHCYVNGPVNCPTHNSLPAPHQSAVEWVEAKLFQVYDDDGREHWDLCKSDALELARRADEEEAQVKSLAHDFTHMHDTVCGLTAQLAAAQERCEECNHELSQCGPQDDDGEPTLDCKSCVESSPSPPCSTHPDAPHGFDRDGSHTAGRYVCDCEGWVPPEPGPHQSAVEWARQHFCGQNGLSPLVLMHDDALELARRCDEAQKRCSQWADIAGGHGATCDFLTTNLAAVQAQVKRYDEYHSKLIVENESLRAQLAAEQDNARQSREEIEALKGNIAAIAENQGEWMRRAMAFEDKFNAEQFRADELGRGQHQWKSHAEKLQAALDRAHQAAEVHQADYLQRISAMKEEVARLRKGITEIKAGTRIGWFMTDLGAKCEKLLNP